MDTKVRNALFRLGIGRGDRSRYAHQRTDIDDVFPIPTRFVKVVARSEAIQRELLANGRPRQELWEQRGNVQVLDLGEGRLFIPDYADFLPPEVLWLAALTFMFGIPTYTMLADALTGHWARIVFDRYALLVPGFLVVLVMLVRNIRRRRALRKALDLANVYRSGLYVSADALLVMRPFPDAQVIDRAAIQRCALSVRGSHTLAIVNEMTNAMHSVSPFDVVEILEAWRCGKATESELAPDKPE